MCVAVGDLYSLQNNERDGVVVYRIRRWGVSFSIMRGHQERVSQGVGVASFVRRSTCQSQSYLCKSRLWNEWLCDDVSRQAQPVVSFSSQRWRFHVFRFITLSPRPPFPLLFSLIPAISENAPVFPIYSCNNIQSSSRRNISNCFWQAEWSSTRNMVGFSLWCAACGLCWLVINAKGDERRTSLSIT